MHVPLPCCVTVKRYRSLLEDQYRHVEVILSLFEEFRVGAQQEETRSLIACVSVPLVSPLIVLAWRYKPVELDYLRSPRRLSSCSDGIGSFRFRGDCLRVFSAHRSMSVQLLKSAPALYATPMTSLRRSFIFEFVVPRPSCCAAKAPNSVPLIIPRLSLTGHRGLHITAFSV